MAVLNVIERPAVIAENWEAIEHDNDGIYDRIAMRVDGNSGPVKIWLPFDRFGRRPFFDLGVETDEQNLVYGWLQKNYVPRSHFEKGHTIETEPEQLIKLRALSTYSIDLSRKRDGEIGHIRQGLEKSSALYTLWFQRQMRSYLSRVSSILDVIVGEET
jgi:hypothetical protein